MVEINPDKLTLKIPTETTADAKNNKKTNLKENTKMAEKKINGLNLVMPKAQDEEINEDVLFEEETEVEETVVVEPTAEANAEEEEYEDEEYEDEEYEDEEITAVAEPVTVAEQTAKANTEDEDGEEYEDEEYEDEEITAVAEPVTVAEQTAEANTEDEDGEEYEDEDYEDEDSAEAVVAADEAAKPMEVVEPTPEPVVTKKQRKAPVNKKEVAPKGVVASPQKESAKASAENDDEPSEESKPARKPRVRKPRVVTITGEQRVKTTANKRDKELIELTDYKFKREPIIGILEGCEPSSAFGAIGIVHYGGTRILIPADKLIDLGKPEMIDDNGNALYKVSDKKDVPLMRHGEYAIKRVERCLDMEMETRSLSSVAIDKKR